MRIAVVGAGAVGGRAARQLASTDGVDEILIADRLEERRRSVCTAVGERAVPIDAAPDRILARGCDAALLALPARHHAELARAFLAGDVNVVSTSDAVSDVSALLDLDAEARERERSVVVGAGFSPGLGCLLARHAAADLDHVDEVHVARIGSAGPACAHHRHRALAGPALEWRDGRWVDQAGGSGRQLCWFPDPIGGRDCYRGALSDPLLLVPAFPGVDRVTARVAATGGERLLSRLPMFGQPRREGDLGAVRIEVRGRQGAIRQVQVYGAIDRPGVAAGTVAALACVWSVDGRLARHGAGGLAELAEAVPMLAELARRGVKAAVFEGVPV
ncbi:MAG: Gfo/Idh/MocA family oxidoreductase [Acidimicrobiales bacterium]